MNKEWYQSKTMWLNIITIGLGVFEVITKTYPLDPQTLVLINGIGNLLLRVISKEQITFGGKPLLRR